jgi:long-chain acyl-CoA synthetase
MGLNTHLRSWSYNQTRAIAEWFAASLYRNGFKIGDRLSNMIPYSPPYIFSLFAGFRLGGIHVQLNPMYGRSEIEFVLNDSGARYMVVQDEQYERVKTVQERTSLRKIIVVSSGKRQLELDAADHFFEDLLIPGTEAPKIAINLKQTLPCWNTPGESLRFPRVSC